MQKYEPIEKAIEENDIDTLRGLIGTICYTSRDFSNSEFDEVVAYVISKGIKLKDDKLVGDLVSAGKTTYTEDDFTSAVYELKKNFCDERINDVKKIGKALYKTSAPKTSNASQKQTGTSPNAESHQKSNALPIMVLVAVAVVAVVLFCLKK
jgi:hypothetical protein